MAAGENFRCVVVGEGTLPIICSEAIRQRGHEILAVVSPDPAVLRWGRLNGIAQAAEPTELPALLEGAPFEYLFSIVNFQKIPDRLLKRAQQYAINYHDGPLPRYAGTHATSWALLNGETRYAVTWHVMTRRSDAGDILKQVPVDIEPDDTALSLNAKCFESAVTGFLALLDDLEADEIVPRPQDLTERSFFRRSQRPTVGCTLSFEAPAEYLYRLMRALDFGPYLNPLGLPKIALGQSFALVTELDVLDGRAGSAAGTVVEITAGGLIVTTATDDVALAEFFTIDGAPMSVSEMVEREGLRAGARVGAMEEGRAARLASLCEALSGHEPFWLAELAEAQPTRLPCVLGSAGPSQRVAEELTLDSRRLSPVACAGQSGGDSLLTAFAMFLVRLTGTGRVNVGFSDARINREVGDLHPFFSTCLPLCVTASAEASFEQFAQLMSIQLENVRAHRGYARDAPVRDPVLRAKLDATEPSAWPIGVEILDGPGRQSQAPLTPGRVLTARIDAEGTACTFVYDPGVLDPALVEGLSRQFRVFLETLPVASGNRSARTLM